MRRSKGKALRELTDSVATVFAAALAQLLRFQSRDTDTLWYYIFGSWLYFCIVLYCIVLYCIVLYCIV